MYRVSADVGITVKQFGEVLTEIPLKKDFFGELKKYFMNGRYPFGKYEVAFETDEYIDESIGCSNWEYKDSDHIDVVWDGEELKEYHNGMAIPKPISLQGEAIDMIAEHVKDLLDNSFLDFDISDGDSKGIAERVAESFVEMVTYGTYDDEIIDLIEDTLAEIEEEVQSEYDEN